MAEEHSTSLFRRDDVASYLGNLGSALDLTAGELGDAGTVDLFELTRRLGHRMGLAMWAGRGAAQGDAFERLVRAFDVLDGSDAFVHPDAMADDAATGKRAERDALDDITEVLDSAIARHDSAEHSDGDLFARMSTPGPVKHRGRGGGVSRSTSPSSISRRCPI